MKEFRFIAVIAVSIFLVACGGGAAKQDDASVTEEIVSYEGMRKLDLRESGFEGTIYIPNEEFGQLIIERTNWGSVMISVGDRFGIELQQEPMSFESRMNELKEDQVFETEFLENTPPLLKWKNTIPDSGIEPEFHFFYSYSKDNFNVSISSFQSEQYSESALKKMIASANSYNHIGE